MSAIGTKRTFVIAPHMSAFGGKADMPFCAAYVRFDPKRTSPVSYVAEVFSPNNPNAITET